MDIQLLKSSIFQNDHVIKSFLEIPENKMVFNQVIELNENSKAIEELNRRFKEFFLEIKLRKYISTIIHNTVVELDMRTKKKEQMLVLYDEKIQYKESYVDIESLVSIFEDERIKAVLKSLTEREKTIITLLYVKDQKEVEIAKHLNISQQAVSKTKHRAIRKIRGEYWKGE